VQPTGIHWKKIIREVRKRRLKAIVSNEAEKDIQQIQDWYEEQGKGLGNKFILSLSEAIKLLRKFPKIYAEVENEIRKAVLSKYPYAVYYSPNEAEGIVDILAIIHTSRSPEFLLHFHLL